MSAIYDKMYKAWKGNGGELFVHFSTCWQPGDSGFWGALEQLGQSVSQAPGLGAAQPYLDML